MSEKETLFFENQEKTQRPTTGDIVKQFDGDVEKALRHILRTYKGEALDPFVFEWSKEESQLAYKLIVERAEGNEAAQRFGLTAEEVLNKHNPYYKKLCVHIIVLITVLIGGIFVIAAFANDVSDFETFKRIGLSLLASLAAVQALRTIADLKKLIDYSKLKKRLRKTRQE